jgi:AcrR family transcriptional regulator
MAEIGLEPRERILNSAYGLFATRGVRDVGIDEVIRRSRVAMETLYKYVGSKDDLVLAFLEIREQRWTGGRFGSRRLAKPMAQALIERHRL